MPDVRARIKPLRPRLPRKINALLKVESGTKSYMLVGTAFDYLLRFELQRQAPHAQAERWVAESAPDLIWRESDGMIAFMDPRRTYNGDAGPPPEGDYEAVYELAQRVRSIVEGAKIAVATYLKSKRPSSTRREELASHAIRLAQLDEVYRSKRLDAQFETVDPADVQDLLALLAIVPFDTLLHKQVMLLNPTFGDSSPLVGGADADLITGDMLVDFKTTKKNAMNAADLDQLLGYFLLARNQRRSGHQFPEIKKLGLYFCRHGYLWAADTSSWTDHPQFLEVEKWFLKRAGEVFGSRKQRTRRISGSA